MVTPMTHTLERVGDGDLDRLCQLVAAYHAFEGIVQTPERRRVVMRDLLANPAWGAVWFVHAKSRETRTDTGAAPPAIAGYVAVVYGYSIELGGRDAIVDELYLSPPFRGAGLGRAVLADVMERVAAHGIIALHLEVDTTNARARRLYEACGFSVRDKYHLMTARLGVRQMESRTSHLTVV